MKNFNNEDFVSLEKYVVVTGENNYDDRSFEIEVDGVQIILCMDEQNRLIQILTVDGEVIDSVNTPLVEECLETAIEDSKTVTYTDKEERLYNLYTEDIRPNTECPMVDAGMYIIQVVDWNIIKAKLSL